jgi:hypothetical protein
MRLTSIMVALAASIPSAECIDGKWDPTYAWVRDCTPGNTYDGLFPANMAVTEYKSETKFMIGGQTRTLTWKLKYYKSTLPGAPVLDKVPLIFGLHPWSEGSTLDQLLDIEPNLLQNEGGWENIMFLSVALETVNNLNTWWDGGKVGGVPTTWAMDALVDLLKARIKDAASLLTGAGATDLANKSVDVNRVYLVGTSMGGSGAYHLGVRHPELFAAVHANAGFADYDGPCGTTAFCNSFTNDYVGTAEENLQMKGVDGKNYPARSYSNMSWFIGTHNGASWSQSIGNGARYEPPYLMMTHGTTDDVVNIASANRLFAVLKEKKFGCSYYRHGGGHGSENFLRLHWLLGFRRDLSYPAFSNNSTDNTTDEIDNDLDKIGWMPGTIVDQTNRYEIRLIGPGTTDVTLRRLQHFVVKPSKGFRFWLNTDTGSGTAVTSDTDGLLTIPKVQVGAATTLIIKPDENTSSKHFKPASNKVRKQGYHRFPDGIQPVFSREGDDVLLNGLGRLIRRAQTPGSTH